MLQEKSSPALLILLEDNRYIDPIVESESFHSRNWRDLLSASEN